MSDRDERLYEALLRLAIFDHVAEPLGRLALEAGLSEAQVRRGLRSLAAQGVVDPAGKDGETTVFHLTGRRPGPQAASRRDATTPSREESSSSSSTPTDLDGLSDHEPVAGLENVGEGKIVEAVEKWVKRVGMHYDREAEVREALFARGGLVWRMTQHERWERVRAVLLADEGWQARTLALWRGHRHVGERLDREQVERLRPREPHRSPAPLAAPAEVLREMPEPTATELAAGLVDEARDARNGDRAPDPEWPDLDWPAPDF